MIEFAMPWAWIGLPLPLLVQYWVYRTSKHTHTALIVPHFNLLNNLCQHQTVQSNRAPWWLCLSWALLVCAASGPRWIGPPTPHQQEAHNIMLALDVSGSMAVPDMVWNHRRHTRLDVVKHAATEFVSARIGDKIGLILFGSRPYLQTPLTFDKEHILLRLDDASVGLAGNATALGDAIGLAIKHLQHTPTVGRVLIVLTDGANNAGTLSPHKAAELAKNAAIKTYTIGLGTDAQQSMLGLGYLANAGMELDEHTLQTIASTTGGRYFRATDQQSLQAIYQLINAMETVSETDSPIRPRHDYYAWPLSVALGLLFGGVYFTLCGRLWPASNRRSTHT